MANPNNIDKSIIEDDLLLPDIVINVDSVEVIDSADVDNLETPPSPSQSSLLLMMSSHVLNSLASASAMYVMSLLIREIVVVVAVVVASCLPSSSNTIIKKNISERKETQRLKNYCTVMYFLFQYCNPRLACDAETYYFFQESILLSLLR